MKKILFIIIVVMPIFLSLVSSAQRYAPDGSGALIYIGPSINKTWSAGVGYVWRNKNTVYAGYSRQFNNSKIEYDYNAIAKSNVVLTPLNETIDLGYEYLTSKRLAFGIEGNLGTKKYYPVFTSNDKKKKELYKKESIWGVGLFASYYINNVVGVGAGYNTLKSVYFTFRVRIVDGKM